MLLTLLPPLLSLLHDQVGGWLSVEIMSIVLNVVLLAYLLQLKALNRNGSGRNVKIPQVEQQASASSVYAPPEMRDADTASNEANLPIDGKLPLPLLSEHDVRALNLGKMVVQKDHANGQGMVAQRINVPAATVWANLLAFEHWPKMISDCASTRVYYTDGKIFKVEVVISVALLRVRTFVEHRYDAARGLMTWSLDPNFESDLLSNSGFWHVRADTEDPNCCIVFYSVTVGLQKWAPRWLDSFIAVQGLPRAISWVKTASEKKSNRRVQSPGNLCYLGG